MLDCDLCTIIRAEDQAVNVLSVKAWPKAVVHGVQTFLVGKSNWLATFELSLILYLLGELVINIPS